MKENVNYAFMNELDVELEDLFKQGDLGQYVPMYKAWMESGEKVLKITCKNSKQRTAIYNSMSYFKKRHNKDWTIFKSKTGLDLYFVRASL